MDLRNIKIRVESPEHSKAIQEYLFSRGVEWQFGGKQLKYLEESFLYVEDSGYLSYGMTEKSFLETKSKEVEFKITMQAKPVVVKQKLTVKQISDLLGYEVEIIGEK